MILEAIATSRRGLGNRDIVNAAGQLPRRWPKTEIRQGSGSSSEQRQQGEGIGTVPTTLPMLRRLEHQAPRHH